MGVDKEKDQPGITSLLKQLLDQSNELLRQHVKLFRYELKEDAAMAAKYSSMALVGALIAYTSFIFLGFFILFLLALIYPLWLASLIVTIIYFFISIIALLVAQNYLKKITKNTEEVIEETTKTSGEAKKWLQSLK